MTNQREHEVIGHDHDTKTNDFTNGWNQKCHFESL